MRDGVIANTHHLNPVNHDVCDCSDLELQDLMRWILQLQDLVKCISGHN